MQHNIYKSAKELLTVLIKTAGGSSPLRGSFIPPNKYLNSIYGMQNLGSHLSQYYQNLPEGLRTAVDNSKAAWDKTDKKYKMRARDDMAGMYRNIPIIPIIDDSDGSTGFYDFFKDRAEVNEKDKYVQGSKEHELTHGLHLRNAGLDYKKDIDLNFAEKALREAKLGLLYLTDFKSYKLKDGMPYTKEYKDYISQKAEIAVRTAEARRRYAHVHGVDVTSPETADKALDWFINADPNAYPEGFIEPATQSELKNLRLYLKDPEVLRRMMPTTTQNNRNNRVGRTYAA